MQPIPVSPIDDTAAEPSNRQSYQEPRGVTSVRLFAVRRCGISAALPVEAMAMAKDVGPPRGEMNRLTGRSDQPGRAAFASMSLRFVLPFAAMIAGLVTWETLSSPSDAESQRTPAPSSVMLAQNALQADSADTLTPVTLETPAEQATPAETATVNGLRISSQSWRRAGLGSNAQVTFTLRNANDYAVRDIEISCSFTRRDGSHLTDRTRTIHDTVNMKSRRTFARMHVGFVSVNADKAKCSLITASRI